MKTAIELVPLLSLNIDKGSVRRSAPGKSLYYYFSDLLVFRPLRDCFSDFVLLCLLLYNKRSFDTKFIVLPSGLSRLKSAWPWSRSLNRVRAVYSVAG
jgi:hypothetical protein